MRALLALQFALIATSNTLQIPLQLQGQPVGSRAAARRHWINRKVCNWLGINSQAHLPEDAEGDWRKRAQDEQEIRLGQILGHLAGSSKHNDQANGSRIIREIPEYVLEYTPLVHLYSGEQFWPGDIGEHLEHVTPLLNYTPVKYSTQSMNLTNLDDLNLYNHGRFVYLTSEDNVEDRPDWLGGEKNIPDIPEEEDGFFAWVIKVIKQMLPIGTIAPPMQGGRSDAPAVLIVVEKDEGVIDAFWFYFYSYNLGNLVFNVRFGNHVGDWEHCLVRFQQGEPKFVFVSEHFFGQAYSYDAIEKYGKRPVIYSAEGTHAMYATPGGHPYVLPFGLLQDTTDRGPLWDPALNALTYTYDYKSDSLRASNLTPEAPIEWFYFNGHWGDKAYPLDDSRQYSFVGQHHYVDGPLGPRFKHLGRRKVCQGPFEDACTIHNWLPPERLRYWEGPGPGEEREDWNGDERDPPGLDYGSRGGTL
ncbi:MAG: hypothetical protein Q9214_000956 [Letrouitia sp. 1 TL-2023]